MLYMLYNRRKEKTSLLDLDYSHRAMLFRLFISRVKKSPDWENSVIRNRPANPLLGLRAIPTANPSHDHPNVNFQPNIP